MSRLAPDLLALKATTHALLDAVGGSEAASVLLGKSASLIRSYGNPNVPDRFMPLDDVMTLERHAQRPIISAWGVERHRADPDRPRRQLSMFDIGRMAKEGSEAKLALIAALADGRICSADRKAVARKLRDVLGLYGELLERVEASE